MLRRDAVRSIVEERGPEGYLKWQDALLEGRNPDTGKEVPKKRPRDFSLRALWEGLVGPVDETLPYAMALRGGYIETPQRFEEQVASSAFPSATGQLVARQVIEGYESSPTIGDQLVDTVSSNMRGERMVGFTHLQGPKVVQELDEYEESSFAEKFVTTEEFKKGRLLSISEEAVFFDQTGEILRRAGMLGDAAAQERELTIVRGVADVRSTQRVYRPQGTAEQLYSAGNNNLLATATPLADWTDIDEALQHHADNISDDRQADDGPGAQPIVLARTDLLVSNGLRFTARRIVNATEVRGTSGNEETISSNPIADLGVRVFSSPYLDRAAADAADDQYDDADDWFIGDFQRQFIWKEIWPLQTFRAPAQNPEQWRRDIVAAFKVRYYGGINAVDERYVIKVNAA